MTEGKTLAELGVQVGDVVECVWSLLGDMPKEGETYTINKNNDIADFHRGSTNCSTFRLISRDQPARVDRYDLSAINFVRGADSASGALSWDATPEGHAWWNANHRTPEGLARLEQMRAQWDAEHAPKTPVREVVTTRKEIVPGVYGPIRLREPVMGGAGCIISMNEHYATVADLTAAIATLTIIRDAMEDGQ